MKEFVTNTTLGSALNSTPKTVADLLIQNFFSTII